MDRGPLLDRLRELFARHGDAVYDDARAEPVTALAHALQCAQLAEWAGADEALVAAALLHDVGHFVDVEARAAGDRVDDRHEQAAVPFLAAAFEPRVVEPVRLHVAAKRWLVRHDAAYAASLSPASIHSLALQGGPMDDREAARFEAMPFAEDAVRLRRWDDAAKEPARATPPLDDYLAALPPLMFRRAR